MRDLTLAQLNGPAQKSKKMKNRKSNNKRVRKSVSSLALLE